MEWFLSHFFSTQVLKVVSSQQRHHYLGTLRNANSQALPQPNRLRNSGGGAQQSVGTSPPGDSDSDSDSHYKVRITAVDK